MPNSPIPKLRTFWFAVLLGTVSSSVGVLPVVAQTQTAEQEPMVPATTEPVGQSQAVPSKHFVSDQLEITLRRGAGTKFGILRMLKSGTPLQILEENGKGYAKVAAQDGTSGWVLTRFLQDEPVARERIAENELRIEEMREQAKTVEEQLNGLQQLQAKLTQMQADKEQLSSELQQIKIVAADALAISEENQVLKQELEESRSRQHALVEKTEFLGQQTEQRWFMIGAGVVILGMLIGLVIPKIRWRRRRSSLGGLNIDF